MAETMLPAEEALGPLHKSPNGSVVGSANGPTKVRHVAPTCTTSLETLRHYVAEGDLADQPRFGAAVTCGQFATNRTCQEVGHGH